MNDRIVELKFLDVEWHLRERLTKILFDELRRIVGINLEKKMEENKNDKPK